MTFLEHFMIPRIYLAEEHIQVGEGYEALTEQHHYLMHVLRAPKRFFVFNEKGQWEARLEKKTIRILKFVCAPLTLSKKILAFCLIKKESFLIEKATELGITDFFPLTSDHTHVRTFNVEKATKYAVGAVQQSERFCLPKFHPVQNLTSFLNALPFGIHWYCALERTQKLPAPTIQTPSGFVVGPEGGFSPIEKELLMEKTKILTLGPLVLRAETAALACLAKTL